jgi:hypothetical protein
MPPIRRKSNLALYLEAQRAAKAVPTQPAVSDLRRYLAMGARGAGVLAGLTPLRGIGAGAIGEAFGEAIGGEEISPKRIAAAAVTGGLGGGFVSRLGKLLGQPVRAALEGAILSGASPVAKSLIEEQELPSAGEVGMAAGIGGLTGGGLTALMGRLGPKAVPPPAPVIRAPEEAARLTRLKLEPTLMEIPGRPMVQTPEIQAAMEAAQPTWRGKSIPLRPYGDKPYEMIGGKWVNPELQSLSMPSPPEASSLDAIQPFLQAARTQAKVAKAQGIPAQVAVREAGVLGRDLSTAAKANLAATQRATILQAIKDRRLRPGTPAIAESVSAPATATEPALSMRTPLKPPKKAGGAIADDLDPALTGGTPSTPLGKMLGAAARVPEAAEVKFAGWSPAEAGVAPQPYFTLPGGSTTIGEEAVISKGLTVPPYPPFNAEEAAANVATKADKIAEMFGRKVPESTAPAREAFLADQQAQIAAQQGARVEPPIPAAPVSAEATARDLAYKETQQPEVYDLLSNLRRQYEVAQGAEKRGLGAQMSEIRQFLEGKGRFSSERIAARLAAEEGVRGVPPMAEAVPQAAQAVAADVPPVAMAGPHGGGPSPRIDVRRVRGEDSEAEILVDGKQIATVFRGWLRGGGNQWIVQRPNLPQIGYPTRAEAVTRTIAAYKKSAPPAVARAVESVIPEAPPAAAAVEDIPDWIKQAEAEVQAAQEAKVGAQAAQTAPVPPPVTRGELAELPPEDRIRWTDRLRKIAEKEQGAISPKLLARLGLGATGALVGGVTDPLGNRPLSAMAGGVVGAALPSIKTSRRLLTGERGAAGPMTLREAAKAQATKFGYTAEEIAKFTPKELEAMEKYVLDLDEEIPIKGLSPQDYLKKSEKGAAPTALMARLGLGTAGALAGGTMTPEDPLAGAVMGGVAGAALLSIPGSISSFAKMGVPAKALVGLDETIKQPGGIKAAAKRIFNDLPQWQRASYLTSIPGLPANALFGPYGSALMAGIEHALSGDPRGLALLRTLSPWTFLKEWQRMLPEARELIQRAGAAESIGRAEQVGLGASPSFGERAMSLPGEGMTAGDMASRNMMMAVGFTEEEARRITMTGEPFTRTGLSGAHARGWLTSMLFPFKRTPINIAEQGLLRTPGVGSLMQMIEGAPSTTVRQQLVRQGMGLGTGYAGMKIGENLDPDTARMARRYLTNVAGQYSAPMALGLAIGAGKRTGRPTLQTAITGAANALPMPSIDPILEWGKFAAEPSMANVPRGAYPAAIREFLEIAKRNRPSSSEFNRLFPKVK